MEWKCKRPTSTGQPRQNGAAKAEQMLRVRVRVRVRVSLVVREMGACALWKKKKGRLRIIRSKDGAPIVRRA